MNRLGFMIDVSHLSDGSAAAAIERRTGPVIASHSAFRHFTPDFERNISDELAKAIADGGGVVQIPFGTAFVNPESAADTQAHFRAINDFNKRNAELEAAGKPLESRAAFNKAWEEAHPPRQTHIDAVRSGEHTSELQSLMSITYADFCLKTKKTKYTTT